MYLDMGIIVKVCLFFPLLWVAVYKSLTAIHPWHTGSQPREEYQVRGVPSQTRLPPMNSLSSTSLLQ